jgi:transcriptional regulator
MSMYEQLPFQPANPAEIDRLVADFPLATLVSADEGRMFATPLPLILQRDAARGEAHLIGHLSRRNPQFALLQRQPRALASFTGAQGYIASSWMSNRRYAPTWNYEFVQFELDVTIQDSPEQTLQALELLSAHVEAPYPNPWRPAEMGPRLEQLARSGRPGRCAGRCLCRPGPLWQPPVGRGDAAARRTAQGGGETCGLTAASICRHSGA